jgi:hypothetical protein
MRVRRSILGALLVVLAGCGAKTGLGVPEPTPERDAGPAPPAPREDAGRHDAFVCAGGECDCLAGGTVSWADVGYQPTCDNTLYAAGGFVPGEWGGRVVLQALCYGTYVFCARVVARDGSRCTVMEGACTEAALRDPLGRVAMPPPPAWSASGGCVDEAIDRSGVETCVSITYDTDAGDHGERELGCFAEDGPWGPCASGPIGDGGTTSSPPPATDRDRGDWEF